MIKAVIKYIIPVIIVLAGIFYYFADPEKSVIMPKCPMKMVTGWQCPSCGAQRAIHALLHGNLKEAIQYNLFYIVAVPFLLLTIYAILTRKRDKPGNFTITLYKFVTNRYTLLSYIGLYIIWWIVRNIIGC